VTENHWQARTAKFTGICSSPKAWLLVSRNKLETSTADRSIKVKIPGRGFRALEFRRASAD